MGLGISILTEIQRASVSVGNLASFWDQKNIEIRKIAILGSVLGLGLGERTDKKRARPARVAEAGQENIKTVHDPRAIQVADSP